MIDHTRNPALAAAIEQARKQAEGLQRSARTGLERYFGWLAEQPAPVRTVLSRSVVDALLPRVPLRHKAGRVVKLLIARRMQGEDRYGTELMTHNGRDARKDLLQELVDALIYAEQLRLETRCPKARRRVDRLWSEVHEVLCELEVCP